MAINLLKMKHISNRAHFALSEYMFISFLCRLVFEIFDSKDAIPYVFCFQVVSNLKQDL